MAPPAQASVAEFSVRLAPKSNTLAHCVKIATGYHCYQSSLRIVPKDKESVMKCSNPSCSHDIGLVSYRRGWFDKRRYCSKKCRDDFKVERSESHQQVRHVADRWTYGRHCAER